MENFYCLIVGSRSFTDYNLFCFYVDHILSNKKNIIIVSGGAKGTDSLAKSYAYEKGYQYVEFQADWSAGKSAGYERNVKMHKYISQFEDRGIIAFWDGKSNGTAHSFKLAEIYNNPIRKILVQLEGGEYYEN